MEALDEDSAGGFSLLEAFGGQGRVEVRRGAGVFPGFGAEFAVLGVEFPGFLRKGRLQEAAFVQEVGEPVVVAAVLADGFLHAGGTKQMELAGDDLLRTFDHPGEDGAAGLIQELLGEVLPVRLALDLRLEGDDDQTAPDAGVCGADLRQMVRVEDEGVGRIEVEGGAVLGLALDPVR